MRLGRAAWGAVAAGIGGVILVVVGPFEDRFFGRNSMRARLTAATLAAGTVLWAADDFGLIAAPYSGSPLGLRDADSAVAEGFSPLVLSSTTQVIKHREQIADFLQRVMDVDANNWLLSDESTVWDFHTDRDNREYVRRAREVYGVDVSDIDPPYLWRIAERISRKASN